MAASGNLVIAGNVTGGQDGARTFGPFTVTTSAAVTQTLQLTLAIGANTITVPTGTTAVVLDPPNGSNPIANPSFSGALTLKGVSGDTGTAMSAKYPTVLTFDTAPSSFVVNSTAVGTLVVWFM